MPISIKCSICGARSPKLGFKKRMKWLRSHRKRKHPKAHRKSMRKGKRTKGKKGRSKQISFMVHSKRITFKARR